MLGDVEAIKGFAAMGQIDLSGIGHISIPGAQPKEFHALVSKRPVGGDKLLKVIDDGMAGLKADRSFARIFKKYGI